VTQERSPAPRRRGIARVVLAVLLLAMATGQLVDFPGFVDALRGYDVGGSVPTWIVAVALVAGEAIGGIFLLRGDASARRSGAVVALAVTIAWSALALTAFARGAAIENCGCFGVYLAQPLRWWVLLEDAEFVALGACVLLREPAVPFPGKEQARSGFLSRATKGATDVRASQAP